MEFFLFRHSEYELLYDCSRIKLTARQAEWKWHPVYGTILLSLSFVYHLLYIPCLVSLHKLSRENSCYKFLFFIGIIDIMALWICGFLTGIFGILGIEFCTCPTLNYFAGAFGLGFWIAETTADWLLAINRCLEIIKPKIARKLFDEGNRCYYWLLAISIYAFAVFFFTRPFGYSATRFSWMFDPPINDFVPGKAYLFDFIPLNFVHYYLSLPPIIYLTINKSTRMDCLRMVQRLFGGSNRIQQDSLQEY